MCGWVLGGRVGDLSSGVHGLGINVNNVVSEWTSYVVSVFNELQCNLYTVLVQCAFVAHFLNDCCS